MLSALARSAACKQLVVFADASQLPEDWEDPGQSGVTAFISGYKLDQKVGSAEFSGDRFNEELLVHLRSPNVACTINLNTVLALATAFVRDQYAAVEQVLGYPKP